MLCFIKNHIFNGQFFQAFIRFKSEDQLDIVDHGKY